MVGFPTAEQAAMEGLRLHDGRFFDGDPINNIPPSRDPAKFNNTLLAELESVLREAEIEPDWDNPSQLLSALQTLIDRSGVAVDLATTEAAGIVELATTAEAQTGTDTARAITPATLDVTLKRLAKTYTASTLTQADVDAVLDGVFFTKGSLIGLASESYVWVQQIFYSSVSATAKRKEIAYSYTGDAVYTRLYTTAWSAWSNIAVGGVDRMMTMVTTSGTWTVPMDGWYKVTAIGSGGGYSSSGSTAYYGSGAGYYSKYMWLLKGQKLTIVIGAEATSGAGNDTKVTFPDGSNILGQGGGAPNTGKKAIGVGSGGVYGGGGTAMSGYGTNVSNHGAFGWGVGSFGRTSGVVIIER